MSWKPEVIADSRPRRGRRQTPKARAPRSRFVALALILFVPRLWVEGPMRRESPISISSAREAAEVGQGYGGH